MKVSINLWKRNLTLTLEEKLLKHIAHDIVIEKDENGNVVQSIKAQPISYDKAKEIFRMRPFEVKKMKTREKMMWFKQKLESSAIPFTDGYNEIIINRETMI